MQRAAAIPATKLKFFALLLSAIAAGFWVWYLIALGFSHVQYPIWAGVSIVFLLVIQDDKKAQLVQNKIVFFVLLGVYLAWAIMGIIQLIQLLTNNFGLLIDLVGFMAVLPILGFLISAILAALSGALYVFNFKKGVDENGGQAPLLNTHV